ncbi:hypothetical protein Nmel_005689 [Mimus melanotis]
MGKAKKDNDFAGEKEKGILCLPEKQTLKWSESFKFKVYVSLVPMPVAQDNDIVFTVGMNSIKIVNVKEEALKLSVSVSGTTLPLKRVCSSAALAVKRDRLDIATIWCSGSSLMDLEAEMKTGGCNVTNVKPIQFPGCSFLTGIDEMVLELNQVIIPTYGTVPDQQNLHTPEWASHVAMTTGAALKGEAQQLPSDAS